MTYINQVKKDKSGKIVELRLIYSLQRPDIEFQFSVETVKKGIEKGYEYKTVNTVDNVLQEGADVILVNGHLSTKKNDTEVDNLSNLPTW